MKREWWSLRVIAAWILVFVVNVNAIDRRARVVHWRSWLIHAICLVHWWRLRRTKKDLNCLFWECRRNTFLTSRYSCLISHLLEKDRGGGRVCVSFVQDLSFRFTQGSRAVFTAFCLLASRAALRAWDKGAEDYDLSVRILNSCLVEPSRFLLVWICAWKSLHQVIVKALLAVSKKKCCH